MGKKVLNLRILLTVILGVLLFLSACGAASNETSKETMTASEPMTSTLPAAASEKSAAQSSDSVTTLPPETVPDQTEATEEEEIFFDKSSRFTVSGLAGGITYREEGDRLITPGAVLVLDGRSFVLDSASGRLLFLGSSLEGVLHEQKVSDPGQAPSYMAFRNEEIIALAGETLAVTHTQTFAFYEIPLPAEAKAIGPLKLLRIGEQIVLCPENDPGCREGYVLKEDGSFAPEKDLLVMKEDLEAELLHVTVGEETWELPMRVVKLPRSAEKYRREEQYDFLSWLPGIGLFMLKTDLKEGTQTVCFFRNDEEAQYFPVPEEPDPLNPQLPVPDRFTVADNGRIYFLRCGEYSADLYSSRRGILRRHWHSRS